MGIAADAARQTTVFIAGGGPVGLAMSLLLDRFGIDCVVVEKSPTYDIGRSEERAFVAKRVVLILEELAPKKP